MVILENNKFIILASFNRDGGEVQVSEGESSAIFSPHVLVKKKCRDIDVLISVGVSICPSQINRSDA